MGPGTPESASLYASKVASCSPHSQFPELQVRPGTLVSEIKTHNSTLKHDVLIRTESGIHVSCDPIPIHSHRSRVLQEGSWLLQIIARIFSQNKTQENYQEKDSTGPGWRRFPAHPGHVHSVPSASRQQRAPRGPLTDSHCAGQLPSW